MTSLAVYLDSLRSAMNRFRARSARSRGALAVTSLLALTELVYLRPEFLTGKSALAGIDYDQLHVKRLAFARQALFGAGHALPAWNPHEMLGSPFAANLQSFPWIPTRLVLLLLDPLTAYAAGVAIAAALAALFTYLYCRRAGLSEIASVAAGWTFASAGYFSSRVLAGHLPLLEAYPALPLLLWLADRALAPERRGRHRFDLAALAFCCACVVSAGHPQVPAYAMGAAFLYVAWGGRGASPLLRARVAGAMALGAGLAMAIWWPMLLLIGRSTRILHLAAPDNDIAMPYGRLLALVAPGIQGWADPVDLAAGNPFTAYPNNAYFWDTAAYLGILPLVAILALLAVFIARKKMPGWRGKYLACLGLGALIFSLPFAASLLHFLPGTFLRSPARLLYLSTFSAAFALGAAIDLWRKARWPRLPALRHALLAALLAAHFADLYGFARLFVQPEPVETSAPAFQATLDREIGDGRIAEEREDLAFSYGARYDDAGGFDSIFLAPFNRAYLALAGLPAGTNEQIFDASTLPARALAAMGVCCVVTAAVRSDLPLAAVSGDAKLYRVPGPAPRARFFPAARAEFADPDRIPDLYAAGPPDRLLLSPASRAFSPAAAPETPAASPALRYSRPSSDEIAVRVNQGGSGYVYVLEAFDPGWKAEVDGLPAPVLPANGFAMAIPLAAGQSELRLRYETPGRAAGAMLSALSLVLLAALIFTSGRPDDPIH